MRSTTHTACLRRFLEGGGGELEAVDGLRVHVGHFVRSVNTLFVIEAKVY